MNTSREKSLAQVIRRATMETNEYNFPRRRNFYALIRTNGEHDFDAISIAKNTLAGFTNASDAEWYRREHGIAEEYKPASLKMEAVRAISNIKFVMEGVLVRAVSGE